MLQSSWARGNKFFPDISIFWQKRPKTIIIGIIVQDNKNSNLFIWPSMWSRLEHAHCLETINNMWLHGRKRTLTMKNDWEKKEKTCSAYSSSKIFATSTRVWMRVRSNGPTDPLHISCICSIWKILHFYSSFSLSPSKSVYHNRNFFIPKIIVVFRTDLHKIKINTELYCKIYDFFTKKTQNYSYRNYCPG
jgi:hypothetical protein